MTSNTFTMQGPLKATAGNENQQLYPYTASTTMQTVLGPPVTFPR